MVFPMLMFTSITNAQQHCVQIYHTKFQQNWTIKVENTDKNLFMPICKMWLVLFSKLKLDRQPFVKGLYTRFFENLMHGLIEDCWRDIIFALVLK